MRTTAFTPATTRAMRVANPRGVLSPPSTPLPPAPVAPPTLPPADPPAASPWPAPAADELPMDAEPGPPDVAAAPAPAAVEDEEPKKGNDVVEASRSSASVHALWSKPASSDASTWSACRLKAFLASATLWRKMWESVESTLRNLLVPVEVSITKSTTDIVACTKDCKHSCKSRRCLRGSPPTPDLRKHASSSTNDSRASKGSSVAPATSRTALATADASLESSSHEAALDAPAVPALSFCRSAAARCSAERSKYRPANTPPAPAATPLPPPRPESEELDIATEDPPPCLRRRWA
mmetsp:Transcript_47037/g.125091  ORF Transcript_47037/g.125091 Transcript_47037/m.125091 type:complete len:295 (-) Transcript_47037:649-1533(-)